MRLSNREADAVDKALHPKTKDIPHCECCGYREESPSWPWRWYKGKRYCTVYCLPPSAPEFIAWRQANPL